MNRYRFCPYCGVAAELCLYQNEYGDVLCDSCGELVIESPSTRLRREQEEARQLEILEDIQNANGMYAQQDLIDSYRRER